MTFEVKVGEVHATSHQLLIKMPRRASMDYTEDAYPGAFVLGLRNHSGFHWENHALDGPLFRNFLPRAQELYPFLLLYILNTPLLRAKL